MGIPSKQIGWSQEAILLHAISKELDRMAGIIAAAGGGGGGGLGASTTTFWRGDGTWSGLGFSIISGSAVLDFPNTAGNSSSDITFAVPGAVLGDVVSLGVPNAAALTGTCYTAWVSAVNTVSVRFNNYTPGAKNPVSSTFKIKLIQ